MQHQQPITYEDITAALIAGLRIGRLTAARRANGELMFAPVGEEPEDWTALETAAAIAELEASLITSAPVYLN